VLSIGFSIPDSNDPSGGSAWSWRSICRAGTAAEVVHSAYRPHGGFGEPQIAKIAVKDGQLDLACVGNSAFCANPHWALLRCP